MTRVIAGSLGGRTIRTPRGDGTRPTSDRVRESLFASLESLLGGFDGLRVLDLFAGSGALGIEALSRGAASAVFVEADRRAAAVLSGNLRDLGLTARGRVVTGAAERHVPDAADLVLCDPPYAVTTDQLTTWLAEWAGGLADDAVVVVERSARTPDLVWPEGLEPLRDKGYGETRLWYGRRHA